MNLHEAQEILGVTGGAPESEVESAYRAAREKLEIRVVQAPTDGLKAKYRNSIQQLEQAYRVLMSREADSSNDFPVITPRHSEKSSESVTTLPAEGADSVTHPSSRAPASSGGAWMAVVFWVMSFLILVSGGWWYFGVRLPEENQIKIDMTARLSELDVLIASLDNRLTHLESELKTLQQRMQDAGKSGDSFGRTFYEKWYQGQEGFLSWFKNISVAHSSRIHLKTAKELQNSDHSHALSEAEAGIADIRELMQTIDLTGYQKVTSPIMVWLGLDTKSSRSATDRAKSLEWLGRLRSAHSEWMDARIQVILADLGDVGNPAPIPAGARELLDEYELLHGNPHEPWEGKIREVSSLTSSIDQAISPAVVPVSEWTGIQSHIEKLRSLTGPDTSDISRFEKRLAAFEVKVNSLRDELEKADVENLTDEDISNLENYIKWTRERDEKFAGLKMKVIPMGTSYTIESTGIEMLWVRPGKFLMGSPTNETYRQEDEPLHSVEISAPFYLGKYEVTQKQFEDFMEYNPSKNVGDEIPVDHICWLECSDFFKKLNEVEAGAGRLPDGYEYGLPTEAQWEYACRAGTSTATSFGNILTSDLANFDGEYPLNVEEKGPNLGQSTAVGQYPANPWGFHDMHGNVWEWCHDFYNETPDVTIDPIGPDTGDQRVVRGGGWQDFGEFCRSAHRGGDAPNTHHPQLGFRVALRKAIPEK